MNEVFRTHVAKGPYTDLARHRGPKVTRNRLIELRETEIDVLIGKGLLNSEMRHDPRVVREALYAHLDQTLGSAP